MLLEAPTHARMVTCFEFSWFFFEQRKDCLQYISPLKKLQLSRLMTKERIHKERGSLLNTRMSAMEVRCTTKDLN